MATNATQTPPDQLQQPGRQALPVVLVASEDYSALATMAGALRRSGYAVLNVGTPQETLDVISAMSVALVVIDLELPDFADADSVRWFVHSLDVPVFLLGAGEALGEHFEAWQDGATGLVARPVDPQLVVRQVAAALTESERDEPEREVLFGPDGLAMYLRAFVVAHRGNEVQLTSSEYELLRVLLEERGSVLSADALSLAVNGYETLGSKNYIEAHISRLRSKLSGVGARGIVQTVRGFGYVVRPD
jgi:DNA-binding response OmpR family regulator